jgi:hypothetical protein
MNIQEIAACFVKGKNAHPRRAPANFATAAMKKRLRVRQGELALPMSRRALNGQIQPCTREYGFHAF